MTAQIASSRGEGTAPQGPGSGRCSHCGAGIHRSGVVDAWVHDDQWAWESDPHPVMVAPERIVVPDSYKDDRGTTRKVTVDPQGVPRDQWGRPVIHRADGSWRGYSRVSSIAKELDDGKGLAFWQTVMTAIGVTITPDIFCKVAELVDSSDNPYEDHKTALGKLAEQAQEAAGSTIKRELGTTLHEWAAIFDRTQDIDLIPDDHQADIQAYADALVRHGVQVLDNEVFVAVDEIEIAGTLDKLLLMPDGRTLVGDVKTGQRDQRYPMAVGMQVGGYSRGDRYDLLSHERSPLGVDQEDGVLIHLPSGSGTCELYPLNLRAGWQNLMLAKDLKRARKVSNRTLKPLGVAA